MRDYVTRVEAVWSDFQVVHGGKHPKFILRRGNHRRILPAPLSPSDRRGVLNWEKMLHSKITELKGLRT